MKNPNNQNSNPLNSLSYSQVNSQNSHFSYKSLKVFSYTPKDNNENKLYTTKYNSSKKYSSALFKNTENSNENSKHNHEARITEKKVSSIDIKTEVNSNENELKNNTNEKKEVDFIHENKNDPQNSTKISDTKENSLNYWKKEITESAEKDISSSLKKKFSSESENSEYEQGIMLNKKRNHGKSFQSYDSGKSVKEEATNKQAILQEMINFIESRKINENTKKAIIPSYEDQEKVRKCRKFTSFYLSNEIMSDSENHLDTLKNRTENLSVPLKFGDNPIILFQQWSLWFEKKLTTTISLDQSSQLFSDYFKDCEEIYEKIKLLSFSMEALPRYSLPKAVDLRKITRIANIKVQKETNSFKVVKKPNNKKKIHLKNNFFCTECSEAFSNGQALGGHMSRKHPNQSEKYNKKKEIRQSRTEFRMAIKNAKQILLNNHGFNYEKLVETKDKRTIKGIIEKFSDEYKNLLNDIKEKMKLTDIKNYRAREYDVRARKFKLGSQKKYKEENIHSDD